jgi:hypothetical protein
MRSFNSSYGRAQGLVRYFKTRNDRYDQKINAGRHNQDANAKKYTLNDPRMLLPL